MTCTIAHGNLLSTVTKVTADRGDLLPSVIPLMSWNTDLLGADHLIHDNGVASFKTWSRRSLSCGRAQTCRNQSNMWNSRKAIARHTKIRDQNPSLGMILPRWTSSAKPQRSKIWESLSRRDRVARARCPRSSVEAGQKRVKMKGAWNSNILFTFGQ